MFYATIHTYTSLKCAYSGFRYNLRIMMDLCKYVFSMTNYRLEFFKRTLLFLIRNYSSFVYFLSLMVQFLKAKKYDSESVRYTSYSECKVVKLTLFYSSLLSRKMNLQNHYRRNGLYFQWQSQYKLSSLLKYKKKHLNESYTYISIYFCNVSIKQLTKQLM